jgi:predicted phage terminase large subunit-like protein
MDHQLPVLTSGKRFKLLSCGRRWGKTALGLIAVIVGHGSFRGQFRGALGGGKIWWVTPSYPIASEVWRDLKRAVEGVATRISEVERRVELPGGGSVMVKSADNPDSLRGAGLDGVVIDEAAFCDEDVWARVIPPTITDRKGWAALLSTPNGFNWFHDLFEFASGDSQWDVFQRPTVDNPLIDPVELENIKRGMPLAAYMQEYEACFTSVAGAEFPGDYFHYHIWVDKLPEGISAGCVALDPSKGKNAKRGDFQAAVYTGFHDGLLYVDAILDRVPVGAAVDNTLSLAHRYGARLVAYEGNNFQEEALAPIFEDRLHGNRLHGIRLICITHTESKEGRIQSLDPFLRNGSLRFVRSPGAKLLVNQLKEFPMAAHDDGPDALEMALAHSLQLLNSAPDYDPVQEILRARGYQ